MNKSMIKTRLSPASVPILFFVGATIVSWLYCSLSDQFNGDFWPRGITISQESLFALLLASLLPYFYIWQIDINSSNSSKKNSKLWISSRALQILFFSVFSWHILMTWFFGVGVAAQEVYSAPDWIKPLIQIGNRIDPSYIGVFYILSTQKKVANEFPAVLLMIILGLMRAGIGMLVYIFIALTIKYRSECINFIRRRLLILLLILPILPFGLGYVYDIRANLRGDDLVELSATDMIFSTVAGRISSYSNFAYIVQESDDFKNSAQQMTYFYFPMQMIGNTFNGNFSPLVTPEKILTNVHFFYDGYATLMASVPGNLFLAWNLSPVIFLLNLTLIISIIAVIVKLSNKFGNGSGSSIGVAMLIYPLTSGVSYEFSVILVNTVLLYCIYICAGKN